MKKTFLLFAVFLFAPMLTLAGDYDHCRGVVGDKPPEAETEVVKRVDPAAVTSATDYKQLSEAAINISPMNAITTGALRKQASCAESTFIRLHPNYFEDDKRPKRKPLKFYSWTSKTLKEAKEKQAAQAAQREAAAKAGEAGVSGG